MTVFGILRVKNEARWILDVLQAMLPICALIFVLDDHSTDGTLELCQTVNRVEVFSSPFHTLDESRDKNYLLSKAMALVPAHHLAGDITSPYWALALDGDELLDGEARQMMRSVLPWTLNHAFKLPVKYLWNSDMSLYPDKRTIRVDGVYQNFARPSLFRLYRREFTYQTTPWAGNLHCSSIPQQLLHNASAELPIPLWHLGYNDRADRVRKYEWYNRIDPANDGEDRYRHCVQGDIPEVPASARLTHAGPLQLLTL